MASVKPRAWQRMLSGRRLDLLDPQPDDIAIEDIAHGLARVARWNGQTAGPHIFSVAQHSLLVEAVVTEAIGADPRASLTALLHDAAEYVVGDLISPFKAVLGHDYKAIEHRIVAAVQSRFDLPEPDAALQSRIKAADRAVARLEASELAGFADNEADLFFGAPLPDAARWRSHLAPLATDAVEDLFRSRFEALSRLTGTQSASRTEAATSDVA